MKMQISLKCSQYIVTYWLYKRRQYVPRIMNSAVAIIWTCELIMQRRDIKGQNLNLGDSYILSV